ncbi:MAG: hypothetical protein ACOX4F_00265 [Atopobiaceae bacterium]|jgi:hypothetical protein
MSQKKRREIARIQTNSLSADEAEELFSMVDETGHTNSETAARQRRHRHLTGAGVDIDPLSADDPSGSNVGKTIAKAASIFVIGFFVLIVGTQLFFGYVRRSNTANLSTNVNVRTVASALRGGVEWGNGFTQFPDDFSVQEADENAGRVEVTVIDTTSQTVLECLAGSQVQAAAFATNALLNQNINTVTYHVQVYLDDTGKIATSSFFGFFKPTGNITSLMTFVWTKTYTDDGGVRFNCTISGIDEKMQDVLREQITNRFTPTTILGFGDTTGTNPTETVEEQKAEAEAAKAEAEAASDADSADANADADADTTSEQADSSSDIQSDETGEKTQDSDTATSDASS